jgi:hypothetical protein
MAARKCPPFEAKEHLVLLGCSLQWTPLGYALEKGNPEIVQILLEHKANVEQTFVSILGLKQGMALSYLGVQLQGVSILCLKRRNCLVSLNCSP